MQFEKRKSGIPLIGDLPWGSNFCHFYQTNKDLLGILVPYFRAGLENNEFCVWVTCGPLTPTDAEAALKKGTPNFKKYKTHGQIEIIPCNRWKAGKEDSCAMLAAKMDKAISKNFEGLRFACSAGARTKPSACYGVENMAMYNSVALFSYPRDNFDAIGLMEVVKKHDFALVRNAGKWEVIESQEARTARDALKRSEEKLHSIFSNMSEGFAYGRIVLDDKGRPCDAVLLEANRAFQKLTGLKVKNVIGKRATQALPGVEKDLANWIGKFGEVALTGRPVRLENYYSEVLKRWFAVSVFTEHKGYFAVMFSDITESKESGRQLAALNDELAASNEELRLESEERQKTEATLRNSQRAALNLMEDANVARLQVEKTNVKLLREIDERKRAEETLRASEQRLRRSQQIAHLGSWELDVVNNHLTWSDEVYRIFGLKPQEFKATYEDFLERVHPDDRKAVDAAYSDSLRKGKDSYEIEHRVVRKLTGEIRIVHEKCQHVRDTAGKIIRSMGMVHDVTEERRREEKIKHLASFPNFNPNPIVELNENGKIIFSNLATIKTLKELKIAKQINLFLPEDFTHILKTFKSGKNKEVLREVRIKDRFFVETLVFMPELKVARIYAWDITKRKEAEELLKKAHDELEEKVRLRTQELVAVNRNLMEEISKRKETEKQIIARNTMLKLLNKSVSRKEYADSLVKLLKAWSKCRCVGLRLLDYEERIPYESYTGFNREFWEAENWLCLKTDSCACTRVITGNPEEVDKPFMTKAGSFYCSDSLKLLSHLSKGEEGKFRGVCIKSGFSTISVIPIRHRGKILGAVHLADEEFNKIDLRTREFLEMLSELIGEGVNKFNLEEKIHKDHGLLDAFFRHSRSPFVLLDREFNFIRVNDAFAGACGRDISEFSGHNYFEYFPDTEKEEIFRRVIVTKAPHQAIAEQFECLNRPREGVSYWDWVITPILDEKENVFLVALSLKDVTEERRKEEKLSATQRELEQARRLSDIGTLAATVAHELRNPLAAINMAASNIRRKANNPDLERHIFNIEKKVTESDQIISNLLFYSRIKPPRSEDINLSEIINECVDSTQGRFEKNISVEVKVDPIKDVTISADPVQIKEVFSNILNNACDAVPDAKGKIEITAAEENNMVKVGISDNGCGIDKFHLEKVFDPFFTTKAKGTGLGLAVCKQIVTLHRGTINIESELEKGTTLTVALPKKGNGY